MAIERRRDDWRSGNSETHYPRLPDLDKLRKTVMLALLAISFQACSFGDDPIPGHNAPDASDASHDDITDIPEDIIDVADLDIPTDVDMADTVDMPTDTFTDPATDQGTDPDMPPEDMSTDTPDYLEDITDSADDTPVDDMDISNDNEVDIDPENPDPDNDKIINEDDICPSIFNPSQISSFPEELNCTALVEDFICFNSGISSDCQNNPDHPSRIASVIFQEWPSNRTILEWTPDIPLRQAITITAENCGRVLISRNGTDSYGRVLEPGESTCINYELGLNDPLNQSLTVCLISEPDGLTSSHCVQLR
jgi:hypothetical protein